ncbi:MAG: GcrA cell cycle regulator [Pseudaminobacter sp.]|nr:GcrA cell cycle regulator [Pseudaminobacter sp.]
MNWTDERVETLRKLWAEGLSASQIAAQLGGVTRNAVIGKVHRLKLSGRGRSTASPTRQKKPSQASKTPARPAAVNRPVTSSVGATALQAQFEPAVRHHVRPSESVVIPISRHLHLVQLNERTCKWPNGDPLSEDFHFCGNESAETGPYCKYHAKIAFQPASERRRSR